MEWPISLERLYIHPRTTKRVFYQVIFESVKDMAKLRMLCLCGTILGRNERIRAQNLVEAIAGLISDCESMESLVIDDWECSDISFGEEREEQDLIPKGMNPIDWLKGKRLGSSVRLVYKALRVDFNVLKKQQSCGC